MRIPVLLFVCAFGICRAADDSRPAPSNVPGAEFPRLDSEGRGTFQIAAPEAGHVEVRLPQGNFDLSKDAEGVWSVTTPPIEPGFHYYAFRIDGVTVFDPGSRAFFGASRHGSGIEVPEPGVDFYEIRDVPHGELRSNWYFSTVTGSWRRLFVYTPPGYDDEPAKRFPVLYIQHGGGEDETGWAVQGRTDVILDNLIASDDAEPMLVVIANGSLPRPEGLPPGYSREGMEPFSKELMNHVVPFVEKSFRTLPGAENRALAGLSMGGGQAFIVGLANVDTFGSIGIFSTGLFGGIRNTSEFDPEVFVPGFAENADAINTRLNLFYVSCGEQDERIGFTQKAVETFRAKGLEVEFASFPGGHEWQVWRKSLHDFAQRIFKN